MAESSSSKQSARSSEHFGQARSRRNNLSLEIRVENADSRGPKSAGVGRSQSKPSSPGSPEPGLKEQRHGSLKIRKGAILHHFLHPLDYYHERKKSRSSTSSINSDASSDTGRWNAFAKSHPDSVSTCPGPYRNSSPMWPIVKRKAKSASSPSGSPRVSPLVSPSLYSSISHSTDIYNPPSKDGPASRLRKFGRQISNPGGAYGDRRSVSPPNKTSNHSRYGESPPNRINPLLLVNPIPKEWRPTHRRSLSDGNARDDDVLSSSSSSVSSSLSTSESDSDTGSSASSSSHSSGRGKHTGHHNHHGNHGHHANNGNHGHHSNDKKPKAHSYHAHTRTNSSSFGSDKPIKERAISVLNNDYTACSPGGTPVNKFLLSVVLQDCNGVPLPVGHSAEVPAPSPVTRSDNEDEVFGKNVSGPVRRRKKGNKRQGEKRAASRTQSESIDRTSSVEKLYSVYEEIIKEGKVPYDQVANSP